MSRKACQDMEKTSPGRVERVHITSKMHMLGPTHLDVMVEAGRWGKARWKVGHRPRRYPLQPLHKDWEGKDWPVSYRWPPLGSSELRKPGDSAKKWLELVGGVCHQGWTPDRLPTLIKQGKEAPEWGLVPQPRGKGGASGLQSRGLRQDEAGATRSAGSLEANPLQGWRARLPCEEGSCGTGPYCCNSKSLWQWLNVTAPLGVAVASLATPISSKMERLVLDEAEHSARRARPRQ